MKCKSCGKETEERPCPYNERFGPVCDDCCEACYQSEPFPCREHDARQAEKE